MTEKVFGFGQLCRNDPKQEDPACRSHKKVNSWLLIRPLKKQKSFQLNGPRIGTRLQSPPAEVNGRDKLDKYVHFTWMSGAPLMCRLISCAKGV